MTTVFDGVTGGDLAFDADAAVGLDSRSMIALALAGVVDFLAGVGTGGVFFAFASEAAVGAYRPDGVLGRLGVTVGVLDRMGVEVALLARERARTVDVFEVVDWPVSCAFRGLVTGGCEETLLGEVGVGFEAGVAAAVDVRAGVLEGVFVVDAESDFNFAVVVEAGFT